VPSNLVLYKTSGIRRIVGLVDLAGIYRTTSSEEVVWHIYKCKKVLSFVEYSREGEREREREREINSAQRRVSCVSPLVVVQHRASASATLRRDHRGSHPMDTPF